MAIFNVGNRIIEPGTWPWGYMSMLAPISPKGLEFDGSDDYLMISDTPELQFAIGGFSVEICFTSYQVSSASILLAKRDALSGTNYQCYFKNGGVLAFYDGSSEHVFDYYVSENVLTHAVYSVDSSGIASLYVDGEYIGSQQVSISKSDEPVYIGKMGNSQTALFSGSIRYVRIWSKALTLFEIRKVQNRIVPLTDIRLCLLLDEGIGYIAADSSGYEHHASIHGATWVTEA